MKRSLFEEAEEEEGEIAPFFFFYFVKIETKLKSRVILYTMIYVTWMVDWI
jgi:hypothetical protein